MLIRTILGVLLILITSVACKETEYVHVGPNWAALNELKPPGPTFKVQARTGQDFQIGDELEFSVTSEENGRLWIVQVDPDDEVTLLYPNAYVSNNIIPSGKTLDIPPDGAEWSMEASEPVGRSVLAFVVTTGDTDLDDVLGSQKSMTKALRLVESTPSWGLAKRVINVEESD